MTGTRVVLIACLWSLCGIAWGADAPPTIPAGARIGIIDMVTNDVTHYHAGAKEVNTFLRTYRGDWDAADLIDAPLMSALTGAGFEAVAVGASEELRKERQSWLVENPRANKLPRGCLKELGRIMTDQNLAALIVVAPGANTDPEYVEDNRWSLLPRAVQGIGFSTSDGPNGTTKAVVFDFTQMVVVVKTPDGPRLVARDWGANRIYAWPGFDPGANLKALSAAQLVSLRPVISDAINNRITTRVMPRIKP
ncbi:MAG: hypothetical protein WDO56_35575 [Gammaproteobacteria bacterium]